MHALSFARLSTDTGTDIGGKHHLEYASTILCKYYRQEWFLDLTGTVCISVPLVASVYVIYWYGPTLRKRSPFAQHLSNEKKEQNRRASAMGSRNVSRRASAVNDS